VSTLVTLAEPRPHGQISSTPRVLYIAYWGATEPLGQSLILPALEKMVALGSSITLLTFEKPADPGAAELTLATSQRLREHGVPWTPLRYHKRPRLPATLFDAWNGWRAGVALVRRHGAQVVHGRTFIGGLIGRAVATMARVPFVYHNEGFYPDEMVDGGFWRRGSAMHRAAKALEARLYASADGLVVLSARAARHVEGLPSVRSRGTPVVVVPSCVDLERFVPGPRLRDPEQPVRLVYSGAVGGRYELHRIGRFLAVLARQTPVRLQVLTRESPDLVAGMLRAGGLGEGLWRTDFVPHPEMPDALGRHDAGLFFLARGSSEMGCSPTKIGEYWACGLPVVTTPGASDTDELIARFRCGVIVSEHTEAGYRRAGDELRVLLADPALSSRCRAAAEAHYALEPACDRQVQLYRELSARST
jgi:glycosyltransferase involved in cell wall biosynthesis